LSKAVIQINMKRIVIFCALAVWSIVDLHPASAQKFASIKPDKPIICYYSYENKPDHVPASDIFRQWRRNSAGRTKTAVIEVDYVNFPSNNLARNAFQYALEIWESHLNSTVPIRIHAEWRSLDPGVLGQAIWGRSYANFGGEQHMNTFYPVALAEKIARKDLNDTDEADIVTSFSSNTNWYYGTDGNTPSGKMDLVTIVLHEIAHGLGFTDTFSFEAGEGSVGLPSGNSDVPFIFDLFVKNRDNENLFQDFESPSTELGTELQSSNLFFDSPLAVAALSGVQPKLYAPSAFDAGSSISHLNESSFTTAGDANRLMTPQIAFAESIHDPGSVLLAILSDMGWTYTHIVHSPLKDSEVASGVPYQVKTKIISENGYDQNTVELHYSTNGINFTTIDMTPTSFADEYQASLPGTTKNQTYVYYISVVDDLNRTFTNPGKMQEQGQAPEQGTFVLNIGPDLASPEITHEPVENVSEGEEALELLAEVTDNLAVKEVVVEYFFNEESIQTGVLQQEPGTNLFTFSMPLPDLAISDEISYRLIATDDALAANVTELPEDGYFTVVVTGILPVQNSYGNNFNQPSNDFFGNSFSIATREGFDNGAIHSAHPYSNGAGPNEESNYIYQLQIPILLDTGGNAIMKFDEVVLVEPGADGSLFGEDDFFDYVIVEGSADSGKSWAPLTDGYDSRDKTVWLTRYNSDLVDDNSEATGDKSLFREREIDMTENGNFSGGEKILIRFRLFADALAYGWGWAIDNLAIQQPVTGIEQPRDAELNVYPVPVSKDLFVEMYSPQMSEITIEISDLQGKTIFIEKVMATENALQEIIDVRDFTDGLYILKAKWAGKLYTRKFLKITR
jgi:hypothetical protein